MPTYAYACTTCDHRFEVQQSFSDAALTECPQCQGRLRKLFNSVGIVFKGSGFYRNDSRNTTAGAAAGAAGAAKSDAPSAGESTTAAKSDSSSTASSTASSSDSSSSPSPKTTPAASSGSAA